jgi:hypothetical protein
MNQANKTVGYLTVASGYKSFYNMAINLIESILDYNPDAKITLVTEEKFLDGRESICDQVIFCDDHYRAKLWGMARTPYDITFYMDADMECIHEDITDVFDNLNDHDMMFTTINKDNEYAFVFRYFNDLKDDYYSFKHNGGCCLYDMTKPQVNKFVNKWQQLYYKQRDNYSWWPKNKEGENDFNLYPHECRFWDQFTLWWLIHEDPEFKDTIDIGIFEDHLRWNYYTRYQASLSKTTNPIVVMHHSGAASKWT